MKDLIFEIENAIYRVRNDIVTAEMSSNPNAQSSLAELTNIAVAMNREYAPHGLGIIPPQQVHLKTSLDEYHQIQMFWGKQLLSFFQDGMWKLEPRDHYSRFCFDMQRLGYDSSHIGVLIAPWNYRCLNKAFYEEIVPQLDIEIVTESDIVLLNAISRERPDLLNIVDWVDYIDSKIEAFTLREDGQYHLGNTLSSSLEPHRWQFGRLNTRTFEKNLHFSYIFDDHKSKEDLEIRKRMLERDGALYILRRASSERPTSKILVPGWQ